MQNAFAATSNQKNMVCQTAFRRKRNRPLEGGPDHWQSRWLRPRRFGKTLNLDMLIPRKMGQLDLMVIEFKVRKPKEEASLEETVAAALQQIEDKAYDTVLAERGFEKERIRHYGFAFEGKHSAERAGT